MFETSQDILEKIYDCVQNELTFLNQNFERVQKKASPSLQPYLEELFSRKGKRMRSSFICLITGMLQIKFTPRIFDLMASVELLHLATLVHDDIIDQSELRRNSLTAYRKWGTKKAVLIGDYIFSQALEMVVNDPNKKVYKLITQCSSKLVVGEFLEIENIGKLYLSKEKYFQIIDGKTASLWESASEAVAIIAESSSEIVEKCKRLGYLLGMAFQIIDDILDYGFGTQNIDKKINVDLQESVVTLPLILFFERASTEQKNNMEDILTSKKMQSLDFNRIYTLLNELDCLSSAKEVAQDYIKEALELLFSFEDSYYKDVLKYLFLFIQNRSY